MKMILPWIFSSLFLLAHSNYAFSIDSIQQWNESQVVCGYSVKNIKPDEWAKILEENFSTGTLNETSTNEDSMNQNEKIVVSYEDFLCCLKNVWISVKNNIQKQKCLKFFMKCIKYTQQQRCSVPWTYYVNLAVHDLRVATMLVVTSAVFFVTSVILVEKCKEDGYDSFIDVS
ncbi:uncharacterized protein LOC123319384 [Coccinella septempunctata]|uniref:uncharacterized protein LOC123319384 n=1 Tax=Coccinella septempunctata TaxID=41139 RepID=UPI001D05FCCF|nr:uncharacterized protein LOC123319384 [Coccinella septempunctata]